jgi:hypothetical protein
MRINTSRPRRFLKIQPVFIVFITTLLLFLSQRIQAQNSDVTINAGTGSSTGGTWSTTPGTGTLGSTYTFTPNANSAIVTIADIRLCTGGVGANSGNAGNVIILTTCASCTQNGDIIIGAAITIDQFLNNASYTLSLKAARDININNSMDFTPVNWSKGQPGRTATNLDLQAGNNTNAGSVNVAGSITLNGGT